MSDYKPVIVAMMHSDSSLKLLFVAANLEIAKSNIRKRFSTFIQNENDKYLFEHPIKPRRSITLLQRALLQKEEL